MLSDLDRAVLDLEGRFWRHQGTKEAAIRTQLDLSPIRYYQRLARLMDDPGAAGHAPHTISRLRRLAARPDRSAARQDGGARTP